MATQTLTGSAAALALISLAAAELVGTLPDFPATPDTQARYPDFDALSRLDSVDSAWIDEETELVDDSDPFAQMMAAFEGADHFSTLGDWIPANSEIKEAYYVLAPGINDPTSDEKTAGIVTFRNFIHKLHDGNVWAVVAYKGRYALFARYERTA